MAGALIQDGAIEVVVELWNFQTSAWVDVSCDVDTSAGIALGAGASDDAGVLTTWEAATCAFRLVGDDWDPFGGPNAAWIGIGIPVRVRWRPTSSAVAAWTTSSVRAADSGVYWTAFTGRVTDDGWPYRGNHKIPARSVVDVVAADHTARIVDAQTYTASSDWQEWPPSYPTGEPPVLVHTAPELLGYIYAAALLYAPELPGQTDIQPPYLDPDARDNGPARITPPHYYTGLITDRYNTWEDMQAITLADLGLLWVNRRDLLAYRPGARVAPGPSTVDVVVCDPVGLQVKLVDVDQNNPSVIANRITVTRVPWLPSTWVPDPGPAPAFITDAASGVRYGYRFDDRVTLNYSDDQSWRIAYALATNSTPNPAPAGVMLSSRADVRAAGLLLASELDNVYRMQDADLGWHRIAPVGWSVRLDRTGVSGELYTFSLDRFVRAVWDDPSAKWDDAATKWGV